MIAAEHNATPHASSASGEVGKLSKLAESASDIGFGVVELAGLLDKIENTAAAQQQTMQEMSRLVDRIETANGSVSEAIQTVSDTSHEVEEQVKVSVNDLRQSGDKAREIAQWVESTSGRMEAISKKLTSVHGTNDEIASISKQINVLAINAKIEAARAGDLGRGFSIVANAINELSQQTANAAGTIAESIKTLSELVDTLRDDAGAISKKASDVLEESTHADTALSQIATSVQRTTRGAKQVSDQAAQVRDTIADFGPAFRQTIAASGETTEGITKSRAQVYGLVDVSEAILQDSVALGGETADKFYIDYVQTAAAEIGRLFDASVNEGRITVTDLFRTDYRPIPGTNPEQFTAPYTRLTDELLPPLQEAALNLDASVVFCAAVDRNGYLPTHNRKFSKPQSNDPVWNAANCRNRRIFDDRVGLKAGRSKSRFLVQTYRRDMGGGTFALMKDVSAPIYVDQRHWGGLRLAYRV